MIEKMKQARVFQLEKMMKQTSRDIQRIKHRIERLEVNKIAKKHNLTLDDVTGVILRMGTIENLSKSYNCNVTIEHKEDADIIDILLDVEKRKIVVYVSSDPVKEIAGLIAKKRDLTITA